MKIIKYFIIVVLTLTVSTCNCFAYMNYSEKNKGCILKDGSYITIVVNEGDTLWNIAKPYYDGKADYRNLISTIKEINEINECVIYPGQEILIPLL